MVAVEREDIETLKVLFEVGIDPNDSSSSCNGSTALTLAIQKDLTLSVKERVRMGAHFTCEKGIEALELAVSKCFFQDLILGENKLFSDYEPKEPFKTAIVVEFKSGRQSLLTKLINCGLSLERTLLLDSTSNQPDLVRLLLDSGIDVNAAYPSLDTALHKSSQNNNIESIKLLVGANSNINAVNKDSQTALHKAVCVVYSERSHEPDLKMEKRNLEIIQFLIENKANIDAEDQLGDTVLHKAVQYDKAETIKLLIEAKADANSINKSGETALHKAVDAGNTEIVKLLIGIGSNINATNVDGDTVLHKAARRNNINVIELLVNAKINIEAVNKNGETALLAASAESAGYGQCAIVQYLIEAGGDVNLEDRYGNTPLSIAVNNDNLMLAHILIKAKADLLLKAGSSVNSQNSPNPMVLAVNSCHKDYVKLLLERGENVNAQDDELNILIIVALRNNSLDIVKILLASGADVINFTNKFGDMTLHFAAKCKK
ncbi:unnamed protein product [Lymnaea stagnalis]|uniref:Uncharacterized protein n=1 Tax=Lymnaea stagnalis TaxID=6523 RepID=A0AAV2HZW6_LYMST